jgi:hypothetical protein
MLKTSQASKLIESILAGLRPETMKRLRVARELRHQVKIALPQEGAASVFHLIGMMGEATEKLLGAEADAQLLDSATALLESAEVWRKRFIKEGSKMLLTESQKNLAVELHHATASLGGAVRFAEREAKKTLLHK